MVMSCSSNVWFTCHAIMAEGDGYCVDVAVKVATLDSGGHNGTR